uniref:Galactokinase N-terminal domain-containing protein n=1 Tax=Capra hircus TaxID=9925 RepID=A0A8C2P0A9_CAPHI
MATEGPAVRRVQVAEHPRLLKLKEMFNSKFGSIPKFYVRAPGRVNIIGEHIDYCGYSVLPMAVEQDMLIAVEPVKTHVLQLANTNPLYPKFGAQGSRLTGAGWGGCTVSIVPADKLSSFLANVHEAYYQRSNRSLAPEKQSLFATKPGGGALVFLEA